jgi:hypothetical protein
MNYSIYPTYDTTLYEKHSRRNTGIDQILELDKTVPNIPDLFGIYWGDTYNSRILIKFDIPYINRLIQAGTVNRLANYYLILKATEARELPLTFTLKVHPLARNWVNGQSYYYNEPESTVGASWVYRDGYYFNTGTEWYSGSLSGNETGSYASVEGGGIWYTYPSASITLDYVHIPDVRIDVTSIVHQWLSGTLPNYGFIIKHTDELEQNSEFVGSVKFFSRDTHTIYIPRLEMTWDDSEYSGINSYSEVDDNFTIYFSNIKKQYRSSSKEIFRIAARDLNPPVTYSTSSRFLQVKRLPTSSYYAIQDYVTTDYIIPFDTGSTKISVDNKGNYFRVDMNTFLPDRFYKIIIKTVKENGKVEQIFDEGYYFKVVR